MAREDDIKRIKQAALMFLLLVLGMLWAPVAVLLDVVVLKHGMPEHGVTEISQELSLFIAAVLMYVMAFKRSEQRGFLFLVAGLFLSMLLRELDYLFDHIQHGFWKYPVLAVVLLSFSLAAIFRSSVVTAMADATRSFPFAYILAGLAIVLFFSRIFGTGSLWGAILDTGAGTQAPALVKNSVQEGLELLGYVLILYGTVMFARLHWQTDKQFTD
jgi:hypothetical protein